MLSIFSSTISWSYSFTSSSFSSSTASTSMDLSCLALFVSMLSSSTFLSRMFLLSSSAFCNFASFSSVIWSPILFSAVLGTIAISVDEDAASVEDDAGSKRVLLDVDSSPILFVDSSLILLLASSSDFSKKVCSRFSDFCTFDESFISLASRRSALWCLSEGPCTPGTLLKLRTSGCRRA